MTHLTNVVIDHDVIGWAHSNLQKLKARYNNIYIVGKDNSPEELMNNNISDLNIAKYCLNNNCDLVTADKKSYVDWFNSYNGITKLIISKFDYWYEGHRPILLIQIENTNHIENIPQYNFNLKISKPLETAPSRFKNKIITMVNESLLHFPELSDDRITLGITHVNDGNASWEENYKIRLNPRRLTYFTIGHELMHLLQFKGDLPMTENSTDIFTLARSMLFLDEPPCYLKIPRKLQNYWEENAESIHKICKDAIEYRKTNRNYIKWTEDKFGQLTIKMR